MKLLPLLCLLSPWIGPASAQDIRVVTVEEGADTVLPCRSNDAVEEFDWKKQNGEDENKEVYLYKRGSDDNKQQDQQFKGRVIIFKDELRAGNASIKIHSTKLEDNGTYICVLGPLDKPSRQEFYIRLNVDGVLKIRNVSGAAPEPCVRKLKDTGDWSLLQCKVHGSPKPEVEWRDSSGNVLLPKEINVTEEGGRFYITSKLIVTKTDYYTCVATQKEIHHQINITVPETFQVQRKDNTEIPVWFYGVVVALIVIVLSLIVLIIVLWRRHHHKPQSKSGTGSDEPNAPLNGKGSSEQMTDPQIVRSN